MIATFIQENWLEFLWGILTSGMLAWITTVQKNFEKSYKKKLEEKQAELEQKQAELTALKEGMKAVLHDMLFQICERYLALGYIPVEEAEDILARAKVLWKAYSGLKGNSTGETVYKKFIELPIKSPDLR